MYEWRECRDSAHENDPCGACGDSMGLDLIGDGSHWHLVSDGLLATPYHVRCKPPEADRPRRYETYRGWKIRITDKPVDESRHSALIQVSGPGQDPRRDGTRVVEFSKRAASWEAARDAALEHAQAWIDREDPRDS